MRTATHRETPQPRIASEDELMGWVETVTGAKVVRRNLIAGGNRRQSWSLELDQFGMAGADKVYLRYQPPRPPSVEPYTVLREAEIYRALQGSGAPAARLIAVNPDLPAF